MTHGFLHAHFLKIGYHGYRRERNRRPGEFRVSPLTIRAPAPIPVSDLAGARAALAAAACEGRPAILIGDGAGGGGGWFRALVEAARTDYPDVPVTAILDCRDKPGLVLAGLRAGLEDLGFSGPPELFARLAALAEAAGARLHPADGYEDSSA